MGVRAGSPSFLFCFLFLFFLFLFFLCCRCSLYITLFVDFHRCVRCSSFCSQGGQPRYLLAKRIAYVCVCVCAFICFERRTNYVFQRSTSFFMNPGCDGHAFFFLTSFLNFVLFCFTTHFHRNNCRHAHARTLTHTHTESENSATAKCKRLSLDVPLPPPLLHDDRISFFFFSLLFSFS
jgi:hypothetical protein